MPLLVAVLAASLAMLAGHDAQAGNRSRNRSQVGTTQPRTSTRPARRYSHVRTTSARRDSARNHIAQYLQKTANKLLNYGISKKNSEHVAEHIGLGMPTDAGRTNPNDYLLARNGYVVGYSRDLVGPKWVAWKVSANNLKANYKRSKSFRSDPTLPKSWPKARNSDFKRSGWTRGHLVASGERSADRRANSKTFVYSNIIPQAEKNNAGPWNHLEHYYRDLAGNGHEVYVLAGGVYSPNPERIGANKVAVPHSTWKIVVVLKKGQTLKDVDANTRVISVVMPNDNTHVRLDQSFADFRTSPAAIEGMTGQKFFTALPPDLRRNLLGKVDKEKITPPRAGGRWHQRKIRSQRARDLQQLRQSPANSNSSARPQQSSTSASN